MSDEQQADYVKALEDVARKAQAYVEEDFDSNHRRLIDALAALNRLREGR